MRGAILCLMIALAGCTQRANRQASLPPAPAPAPVVKPAPEPDLSIPQTSARLPSPQKLVPEAIPPEKPPEEPVVPEKAEVQPVPKIVKKAAVAPTKPPETSSTPGTAPATVPPETEEPVAVVPAPSEPAPFQPILSAEQQNTLKAHIAARKGEIASLLAKANEHPSNDQTIVERVKSSLKLSDDAAQRGDFTQASALAERALVLAQELKVE